MKEEDQKKLFTEFGKITNQENSSLNPNGCGLGLFVANNLVKLLGPRNNNKLTVKSIYG